MPIKVHWANDEQTVVLMSHIGRWTWGELFDGHEAWTALVRGVDHTVNVIVDHTSEIDPPTDFARVMTEFGALQFPDNVGLMIIVGTYGATRIGNELFSKIYRKLHLVELMADAYALIRAHEERHKASPPDPLAFRRGGRGVRPH